MTSRAADRDLNDVEVFAKVVEERSFTGAGRLLNMPRSTVSRRIAVLEQRLGVRLLHRTTRKLRLTDVGRSYYERCSAGLSAIDDAEAGVLAAREVPLGKLRISAPLAVEDQLGAALATFLASHPQVTVEVVLQQRMVDLIGEDFDLAIRATDHLPDSSLVARPLMSGHALLFASKDYLAGRAPIETPEQLAEHDLITFGRRTERWVLCRHDNTEVVVPVSPRLVANGPNLALTTCCAGAGVALLPFSSIDRAQELMLTHVLPDYRGFYSRFFLVYPSAQLMSATLRAACDHLARDFTGEEAH